MRMLAARVAVRYCEGYSVVLLVKCLDPRRYFVISRYPMVRIFFTRAVAEFSCSVIVSP